MIRRIALIGMAAFFLAASCKSTSSAAADVVITDDDDTAPEVTAETAAAQSATDEKAAPAEKKPAPKKQTKEEKKAAARLAKEAEAKRKADEKRRKREKTDTYLGVVYTPETKADIRSGKVHISLKGNTGSFNISAVAPNKRETPIFSTADDSSTTFFSVLVGKREYRLNRAASIASQVRLREGGGQIAYTLEGSFQIVLDFSTLSSVAGGEDDIVKISVYTTNTKTARQTLAIRAVLDTILGENFDYHFITATGQKIGSERQFTSFQDERYFISTNEKVTAQFLVAGKTVLIPQTVSFANKDDLTNSLWTPVVTESRSFNSVLAYNNSAMCINWPYFTVEAGQTSAFTFYIALGTDGDPAKGIEFIDSLVDDPRKGQEFGDSKAEILVRKPDVDFVVAPITDDKLDPEYIQNLIDRINSLNSDPALVDRTEVRQLNAELDAILDKIRQMNQQ